MYKFTVGILRVSTTKQDLFTQRAMMEAEIQRRGLTPIPFDQFYLEPGGLYAKDKACVILEDKSTGRKQNRKTYRWVMDQVKARRVSAVIACYHDRIGRNAQASLEFARECIAAKTELYSLSKRVDLTSPEGALQFTMLAGIAQYFSDQLSQRVRDTYQMMKEEAERTGKPLNWGGRPKGCTNVATAKLMPRLEKMVKAEMSIRHIVQVLGIDYKTARKHRARILAGEGYTVAKE